MPRDLPDWGALSAQATVYEVTDMGEMAVRLGSIVSHDRRGDVIWFDDFESGLSKWAASVFGAGSVVDLSVEQARHGRFSARLVAGSDDAKRCWITHRSAFAVLSRFGIEVSFNLATDIDLLQIYYYLYNGTQLTLAVIQWIDATDTLQYLDDAGNWVTFATGVKIIQRDNLFHTGKLVVDAINNQYVRFLLNNVEY
ncbi:hypothetical protein LCGC14_2449700, partial [marine sediment metagenome]